MKRLFDLLLALILSLILAIPAIIIALLVRFTSSGPIIYWSTRMGKNNVTFPMPKFRTMLTHTPVVATHLLTNPDQFLTPIGSFLRKSSLDEIPQLWCILNGDMSFVGPRPSLPSQTDLNTARTEASVHTLVPGLTGWAQVNGRDEIPNEQKVAFDAEYLQKQSFFFDLKIMCLTAWKVVKRDGVAH